MANILKMMKQAASMQKEMKQIQKDLARQTVEFSAGNGKVTAVARGDMSLERVTIDPEFLGGDARRVEQAVLAAVNGALAEAKKKAGQEMSKLTSGMGLPGLT